MQFAFDVIRGLEKLQRRPKSRISNVGNGVERSLKKMVNNLLELNECQVFAFDSDSNGASQPRILYAQHPLLSRHWLQPTTIQGGQTWLFSRCCAIGGESVQLITYSMPFLFITETNRRNIGVGYKLGLWDNMGQCNHDLHQIPRRIHRLCNFAHGSHKNSAIPHAGILEMSLQSHSSSHRLPEQKGRQAFILRAFCRYKTQMWIFSC